MNGNILECPMVFPVLLLTVDYLLRSVCLRLRRQMKARLPLVFGKQLLSLQQRLGAPKLAVQVDTTRDWRKTKNELLRIVCTKIFSGRYPTMKKIDVAKIKDE